MKNVFHIKNYPLFEIEEHFLQQNVNNLKNRIVSPSISFVYRYGSYYNVKGKWMSDAVLTFSFSTKLPLFTAVGKTMNNENECLSFQLE